MQPAVLIRLRPRGPWRFGAGDSGRNHLDTGFRSDRVYSAVTLAMEQLGFLEPWLDATARAGTPAAAFTSLFPFQGDTLFAPPPASLWPPPAALLTSPSPVFLAKMRWDAVRFIPLALVETLVTGQPMLADQWVIDAESGCLLRRDRPSQSPFRFSTRVRAAVDRVHATSPRAETKPCVEFESESGLWLTVRFADAPAEQVWGERVAAAFRLLADTGFGGGRSSGWGQTAEPELRAGSWPGLLFPRLGGRKAAEDEGSQLYWLLSLYAPATGDQVNWKAGDYRVTERGGRVESRSGSGALKKTVRMVAEGSVVSAAESPVGVAVDVAPAEFAHPVYRSGFALALRLPVPRPGKAELEPVETTPTESSLGATGEEETPVQEASSTLPALVEESAVEGAPPGEPEAAGSEPARVVTDLGIETTPETPVETEAPSAPASEPVEVKTTEAEAPSDVPAPAESERSDDEV